MGSLPQCEQRIASAQYNIQNLPGKGNKMSRLTITKTASKITSSSPALRPLHPSLFLSNKYNMSSLNDLNVRRHVQSFFTNSQSSTGIQGQQIRDDRNVIEEIIRQLNVHSTSRNASSASRTRTSATLPTYNEAAFFPTTFARRNTARTRSQSLPELHQSVKQNILPAWSG